MRTKYGTRERLALKLVDLSINNHIVDLIHKHYLINGIYSASAPNERVSRITQLAKLSSTTHRSCSQLTFFNFLTKYLTSAVVSLFIKDVGRRSSFGPPRPPQIQYTSFSLGSSMPAVRQGQECHQKTYLPAILPLEVIKRWSQYH